MAVVLVGCAGPEAGQAPTGGEARALKSADDLLDVVCLQALDQVPDCPQTKVAKGNADRSA